MHRLCYLFRWFHINSIWVPYFTFRGNSTKPNKFIWRLFTFHLIIRWRRPISNVFATRCRTKTTAIKNWNDCLVCVYRIQRQVITNYHHLYKKEIELELLLPPWYPIVAIKFMYNYDAFWLRNECLFVFENRRVAPHRTPSGSCLFQWENAVKGTFISQVDISLQN